MTLRTTALQASLSFTISQSLFKFISIQPVVLSNHLILCRPLLLLPLILPSIGVSSNESVLRIRWPKYWSFSFHISPSNEYSGLISFRMDWFDLLAGQGTQESASDVTSQSNMPRALKLHTELFQRCGDSEFFQTTNCIPGSDGSVKVNLWR